MKKRVIRKKKTSVQLTNKNKRRSVWQRAAIWGMTIIMSSSAMSVQAAESTGSSMSSQMYVYHAHKGTTENGEGCYSVPVYHTHAGSEAEGGICYQTPVFHVHEGDEQNGGPCYGREIYHEHDGDSEEGGACFEVFYHKHTSACYKTVNNDEAGCTVIRVEETTYDDYEGHDYKDYYMTCGTVVHGTNPAHIHKETTCKKEGKVEGFKLSCKLTELYVERYEMDCIKTADTIDSYQLSCPKTEADIDKYEMGCGRDEATPLGKITVIGKLAASKKKAELTAVYEDMSEGEVVIDSNAFSWYNEKGVLLGNGETLQVNANGKYYVMLHVQNEDVNEKSLRAELQVSGIQKKKTETTKDDTGKDSSDDSGSGDEDSGAGSEDSSNGTDTPAPISSASPSPIPTVSPMPTATPVVNKASAADNAPTASPGQKDVLLQDADDRKLQERKPVVTSSPAPAIRKESGKVELEKKESNKEENLMVESLEKQDKKKKGSFLTPPAVKVITVTAGTLVLIAGAGLLLFLFGRSVRVYNDDGKGNLIYLGRAIVQVEEEGYVLSVTEVMTEKSLTNRYCLRCDFFHLWKDEEEELIVVRGERRQIVKIQKEMIAVV